MPGLKVVSFFELMLIAREQRDLGSMKVRNLNAIKEELSQSCYTPSHMSKGEATCKPFTQQRARLSHIFSTGQRMVTTSRKSGAYQVINCVVRPGYPSSMNPLHGSHQDACTKVATPEKVENVIRRSFYEVVLIRLDKLSQRIATRCAAQEECQGCAA